MTSASAPFSEPQRRSTTRRRISVMAPCCPRCGNGSTFCHARRTRGSARTDTPNEAVSCRRSPCRGACSPARACASSNRSSSARRRGATRSSARCRRRKARAASWRSSRSPTPTFRTARCASRRSRTSSIAKRGQGLRRRYHASSRPSPTGAWTRTVAADPTLLFRFSALTFNAHRIHYDRPYATAVEGYPGLVVHGPLTAILLMELVRNNVQRPVTGFSFRGLAALFDLAPFRLVGCLHGDAEVRLEAQAPDGTTAMSATAELG